MQNKIYYKRVRDFGGIFNSTFTYVKQNFKSFFGGIILYTLPVISIITLLGVYLINNLKTSFGSSYPTSSQFGFIGLFVFLLIIFAMILQTIYVTIANQHMILNESVPQGEQLKIERLKENFFSSFWRVLGNAILFGIVSFIVLFIFALIMGGLIGVFGMAGWFGAIIGVFFQFFFTFAITPIFAYLVMASFFVVQRDRVNIFTALGLVFKTLKGNFLITWGISIVTYLICYIGSVIIMIPIILLSVFTFISGFGGNFVNSVSKNEPISMGIIITLAILFVVTVCLFLCVYSIYFVSCCLQFGSNEEKMTGSQISQKIESI
jgi:hypothetical protein